MSSVFEQKSFTVLLPDETTKEKVKVERDVLAQNDFWIPLTGGAVTQQPAGNSFDLATAKPALTAATTDATVLDPEDDEEEENIPTAQAFKMDVDSAAVEQLRKFLHKIHGVIIAAEINLWRRKW